MKDWKEDYENKRCGMCSKKIKGHSRCKKCWILLEPKLNQKTQCVSCRKYHCESATKDMCKQCFQESPQVATPFHL